MHTFILKVKDMKLHQYKNIIYCIKETKTKKDACINNLMEKYTDIPENTFISIYAQFYQRKIKKCFKNHHRKEKISLYYEKYKLAVANGELQGFLYRLSEQVDFPPTLIARIILEQYFKETLFNETKFVAKGFVSKYIKDPLLIENSILSTEVSLCIEYDDHCGPNIERIKRETGLEYEKVLHDILTERGIPYCDETILRKEGYDKTPDFKLVVPIALNNHVINWIESKASFGDEESHSGYLENQFWSYTNRFGPGLVIYWFGFISELDINMERGIMLADRFPNDILKLETLLDQHEESFVLTF